MLEVFHKWAIVGDIGTNGDTGLYVFVQGLVFRWWSYDERFILRMSMSNWFKMLSGSYLDLFATF